MPLPELSSLATEIASDNVSGENCEYDPLYVDLDSLAVEVPETEFGDSVNEGREPDFVKLTANCMSLWERTRDLRVAAYYTIGASCLYGFDGLKLGLGMIDYLVENMWDSFYPQLDPDDNNDPTERVNIMHMLSPQSGSYNDPIMFMSHMRDTKVVPGLDYTIRDVMIAQGFLESSDAKGVDPVLLNAELHGIPLDVMQSRGQCLDEIIALVDKITENMNEKMGDTGFLSMDNLLSELKTIRKFYSIYSSGDAVVQNQAETGNEEPNNATRTENSASVQSVRHESFDIKSYIVSERGDALMLIKKCSDFFSRTEPTSPLPYLLNRALRMSDMNLLDIMREIDENSVTKAMEQLGVVQKTEE